MLTFLALLAWLSSLGLAFLLGYYVGVRSRGNGNGGNGEEMQARRVA